VVAVNFTPMRWDDYRIGLPFGGHWDLVVNSGDPAFSGAHPIGPDAGDAVEEAWHGRPAHLRFDLPPLSAVVFVARREG
jgi:1,4-alpha-glucan branching enzyme